MTDNSEFTDLLRQYYERQIEALQQDIQAALDSPDEAMVALRAALADSGEQPKGNPLLDDVDPSLIRPDEQTLTLPDGREVTQAQIDEFLSKYQGTITDGRTEEGPVVEGVRLTREQAAEHLNRADAEMRERQQAEAAQARSAFSSDWASGNTNRA